MATQICVRGFDFDSEDCYVIPPLSMQSHCQDEDVLVCFSYLLCQKRWSQRRGFALLAGLQQYETSGDALRRWHCEGGFLGERGRSKFEWRRTTGGISIKQAFPLGKHPGRD
jgi:hypothetical protein